MAAAESRPAASQLDRVAAALLAAIVLVQLPVTLYWGSPSEFEFGLWQLLPLWLVLAGIGYLVLTTIGRIGGGRSPYFSRYFGPVLWAAAVWCWLSGHLVVYRFGLLDGSPLEFTTKAKWALPEAGLALLVVALAVWWASRKPGIARQVAVWALAVVLLQAGLALIRDLPKAGSFELEFHPSLVEFGPADNVMVLLLDTFQADIFAEVLETSPELEPSFDGFVFYPDTLGVAKTTALTMPAIHSGLRYEAGWTIDDYYRRTGKRRRFLNELARAGQQVTTVNPFGPCPRRGLWCGQLAAITGSRALTYLGESLLPVDLGLFRIAPLLFKRALYGRGRWLLQRLLDVHPGRLQQERSHELLARMAGEMAVRKDGPPAVRFVHLPSPHAPLVTRAGCERGALDLPKTRANMVEQSRCTLEAVVEVIEQTRSVGIFDSMLWVILADHGAGLPAASLGAADSDWSERAAAANPLMLIKGRGGAGPLQTSRQALQIDDVGKIVCEAVSGCKYRPGRSLSRPGGFKRPRHYLDYTWRSAFWYEKGEIEVTRWEVRGALSNPRSWSRLEDEPGASPTSPAALD